MEDATYLWVAETVLRKHGRPLNARELVNYGLEDDLFPARGLSRTPQKSMQARLSMNILNNPNSAFVRTSRGRFLLREQLAQPEPGSLPVGDRGQSVYTALRREPLEPTELVLALSRENYQDILDFQGIGRTAIKNPLEFITPVTTRYLPRTLAETLDDHKQIITYTVIQYQSKILSFRRGLYNRAANFLRGAQCVGFGGHVSDADNTLFSFRDSGIRQNAAREIWEELMLPKGRPQIEPINLEYLGILNDDSSDVGLRHMAVVLRYWVDDWNEWRHVRRGEASINRLQWVDTTKERLNLSEYEYWSQLVIREFFRTSLRMSPGYKIQRKAVFKKPHILCVVGALGSGKSTTTAFLRDRCGYEEVNSGRVLAQLMRIPPIPETDRATFQEAAHRFISRPEGPSRLGAALAKAAMASGSSRIIVDGVRHPETLEALRQKSALPVALFFVYTPPDVAFEMYRTREGHGETTTTFEEFIDRYKAPVENRVRYMIGDADVITFNWLDVEAYAQTLEELVEQIGAG